MYLSNSFRLKGVTLREEQVVPWNKNPGVTFKCGSVTTDDKCGVILLLVLNGSGLAVINEGSVTGFKQRSPVSIV